MTRLAKSCGFKVHRKRFFSNGAIQGTWQQQYNRKHGISADMDVEQKIISSIPLKAITLIFDFFVKHLAEGDCLDHVFIKTEKPKNKVYGK